MKKALAALAALGAALIVAGTAIPVYTSHSPTASPVHVVNVYLDGLNHLDYRQTCSTIHAPIPFPKMSACEAYFAFNTAMTGVQEYRIVKGSQKVWTETYRGRKLELAVVQYANLTTPYVLTAHLRKIHGVWKIWAATT